MNSRCVKCEASGAAFSARCGHFYHKSCYEYRNVKTNFRNCVKCSRKLPKYYEDEAKLFEIRSLCHDHPEIKQIYDCYESITVCEKVSYDWDVLKEIVKLGWDINDLKYGGPFQFFQACKDDNIEKMNLLI